MILPVPHVERMAAYALADLSAPDGKRLVSLSQNESVRGPSEAAITAASEAVRSAQLYPDPDWTDLRAGLSALHCVPADAILCGSGSLDLIGCIARTFLEPGLAALAPAHAYPFFSTATQMTGARFDVAPETNLTVDIDALLATVREETRIVFLANPGNPTGTRLARSEIVRLRDNLCDNVLLVLDEAYGEFADHLNEPMFDLFERGNTVVLRTFSKAYGLAGSRVGWGIFPPQVLEHVRKSLNPNNVTWASQSAARAALGDQDWMKETCAQTIKTRETFSDRLRELGFDVPQSFTNFALVPFASSEEAVSADSFLKSEGVFLRPQAGAGLPHCLRVTVGAPEDMDLAADLIETWQTKRGET